MASSNKIASKVAEANKDMEVIPLDEVDQEVRDVWAITWDKDDQHENWSKKTTNEKVKSVAITLIKICLVAGCFYLFICSISMLGDAFQILAGIAAGEIFSNDSFLSNPLTGLIIGILVTVLVQSSSTSTSIIITMVSADIIQVPDAVFIIMGTNIGTSVTNTIVSLSQSIDKEQFRRAFAGATVHDIFNLLSVLVLLPLEVVSGYLQLLTKAIIDAFDIKGGADAPDILKVITDPLVKGIVQINKTVITLSAQDIPLEANVSMIKVWCKQEAGYINFTESYNKTIGHGTNVTSGYTTAIVELTTVYEQEVTVGVRKCVSPQDFLFANTGLSDVEAGVILLVVSLFILSTCLILMVKLLNSMMQGSVARIIKKVINTNFKHPFGWVTGYLAMLVGAGLTFCVQSSSVFTSTITPLVGIGVISLKRMYPLTLGSNLGTTTTGILAALASDPSQLADSLQIALVHLFFNISGIIIWYPIPFMRIPIRGAKFLGNTTANYRWFAVLYLISVFFLLPFLLLALSFASFWALMSVVILGLVLGAFVTIVNLLQSHKPHWLPASMRTWEFLPLWMRSLQPYDKLFGRYLLCKCLCKGETLDNDQDVERAGSETSTQPPPYSCSESNSNGFINQTFEDDIKESTKL